MVENGIDALPFLDAPALARSALGFSAERPLLFCAGLLNLAKGQDLLVEALAAPGLEELQLALAGEGEMRPLLERRIAELGLSARVKLLGFRPDMAALHACSDLYVLPSRWEGMPYVLLEAMASARPFIATPVDGARELSESGACGGIARAISAAALAEALREHFASAPEERAQLGLRGRACVRANYTLERMVERTIAVYRELA